MHQTYIASLNDLTMDLPEAGFSERNSIANFICGNCFTSGLNVIWLEFNNMNNEINENIMLVFAKVKKRTECAV